MMDLIEEKLKHTGFTYYAKIDISQIVFERTLRESCASNSCGRFGANYSCPPHVGLIDDCIEKVKKYASGFLFQYVGTLEDSYDFEGMIKNQDIFNELVRTFRKEITSDDCLIMGAGSCSLCEVCGLVTGEPCRNPNIMISSVEANGIFVNPTLLNVGLKYNNGENTVSYVGIVMIKQNNKM